MNIICKNSSGEYPEFLDNLALSELKIYNNLGEEDMNGFLLKLKILRYIF